MTFTAAFRRTWLSTRRAYPLTLSAPILIMGAAGLALSYLAYRAIGGGQVSAEFVRRAGTGDYLSFVAVGTAAYVFTVRLLLWIGRAPVQEQREGALGARLIAPGGRLAHLAGLTAFAALLSLIEVTGLVVAALALGASLAPADPLLAAAGMVLVALFVFGMGVLMCCMTLVTGDLYAIQNTTIYALGALSGFIFPVGLLPGPVRALAEWLPLTAAMDVLRAGMHGTSLPYGRALSSLAVSLAIALAGLALLPRAQRRAMERSY
ncbi:ABC transporter permease [Nonomuraea sp. NPDC050404]|uniref:ABC transporter permease n=1 Tax=Nonomuraea sp. NPDC050404 TaxID=3155783 RepID=UPI0033F280AB